MSYDMIDRFLRNNLDDSDYAEYSAALDALGSPQPKEPEPFTEWLTCPKCNHKSPYSPIKARTLEEDAARITKQAREALAYFGIRV